MLSEGHRSDRALREPLSNPGVFARLAALGSCSYRHTMGPG